MIAVGDPPRSDLGIVLSEGDADVYTFPTHTTAGAKSLGVLALAIVPMANAPEQDSRGGVVVPDLERHRAEQLIEMAARFLALEHRENHVIMSPSPCLGFLADAEALAPFIEREVAVPGGEVIMEQRWPAGLLGDGENKPERLHLLRDRMDGVEMLTEALNCASPLGRFSQLWRFFERAFNGGHVAAAKRLAEFLLAGDTRPNWSATEVDDWVQPRNGAIHANRAGMFFLDSDVQALVPRMLEAAYDVLLNKETWWSPTTTRRKAWRPVAGSADRNGRASFLTQHKVGGSVIAKLHDYFAAYPLALGINEAVLPPAAWLRHEERSVRLVLCGDLAWSPPKATGG